MKSDDAGEGQTFTKPLFLWVQMRVGTSLTEMDTKIFVDAVQGSIWAPSWRHFGDLEFTLDPRGFLGEVLEGSENEVQERDLLEESGTVDKEGGPLKGIRKRGFNKDTEDPDQDVRFGRHSVMGPDTQERARGTVTDSVLFYIKAHQEVWNNLVITQR